MTEQTTLAAALVAALADLSVIDKGRTAKIEHKGGGAHSYEYADLSDVVKMTRPKLAEHGIVALTPVEDHGEDLKVTVVFLHSSGERMDFGPLTFPRGNTAQATGSAITYFRRYALVAALGMAAGDDDDGATAVPQQQEQKVKPNPKAEPLTERLAKLPVEAQDKILDWFQTSPAEWPGLADEYLDKLASVITKAEQKAAEQPEFVLANAGSPSEADLQ